MSANQRVRLIAFYLPQFHPIPENDAWWGRGFTEWTNVAKAKPLFPGHYQPHLPADLGFYDLRLPETRAAQAELAKQHGIEGFCYWHYWFAGKQLLERPFQEVLRSGEPDFPFCLAWANDSWSGVWHGAPNRVLIEQTYPGMDDHKKHFYTLLDAFCDHRYIKVENKPLVVIYKPLKLPDSRRVTDYWRELAHRAGLKGLHLVGVLQSEWLSDPATLGLDAVTVCNQTLVAGPSKRTALQNVLKKKLRGRDAPGFLFANVLRRPLHVYMYKDALPYFLYDFSFTTTAEIYSCLIPNWDNTPRVGVRGVVLHEATPILFGQHVKSALRRIESKSSDHRIAFIKSWNEWAEGNHLEPDLRYGKGHLEILKQEIRAAIEQ